MSKNDSEEKNNTITHNNNIILKNKEEINIIKPNKILEIKNMNII